MKIVCLPQAMRTLRVGWDPRCRVVGAEFDYLKNQGIITDGVDYARYIRDIVTIECLEKILVRVTDIHPKAVPTVRGMGVQSAIAVVADSACAVDIRSPLNHYRSTQEFADWLGVSKQRIHQLLAEGRVCPVRVPFDDKGSDVLLWYVGSPGTPCPGRENIIDSPRVGIQ